MAILDSQQQPATSQPTDTRASEYERSEEFQIQVADLLGGKKVLFDWYEHTWGDRFLVRRLNDSLEIDDHLDATRREELIQALSEERAVAPAEELDTRLLTRAAPLIAPYQLAKLEEILKYQRFLNNP